MPIRPENRSRYPVYWRVLSGFIRWSRARAQCEWCGAVHGCPHPVTGSRVVLTTAHVHDHRPEMDRPDNLAALCQRCHLGHDRPRHMERAAITRASKRGQPDMFGATA